MLDEFLQTLSNEAQLKIALRLTRLALPVWQQYFTENPGKLAEVNALVTDSNRVAGAYKEIGSDLPEKALVEMEKAYAAARSRSQRPATVMKEHVPLSPVLYTFLGPLTNKRWDDTLPNSVRLVFTAVWNILTWLLYRERNDAGETHIYISVNQAADALMSEKLKSVDEINAILTEYAHEKRHADETGDGAGGMRYASAASPAQSAEDVYQKIIGPTAVTDAPNRQQAAEIVRQMREEGKSYWDEWEEYYTGTNVDYSFDKEEQRFKKSEADVIVGSFFYKTWLSEAEMIEAMQKYSLLELRKAGFNI